LTRNVQRVSKVISGHRVQDPMRKQIVIIDGHPDCDPARFGHATAGTHAEAAVAAGHHVSRIDVAQLDFPILRTRADREDDTPIPARRFLPSIGAQSCARRQSRPC